MQDKKDSTIEVMKVRNNLKLRLIFESICIGLFAGLIMVLNRVLIDKMLPKMTSIYEGAKGSIWNIALVFAVLIIMGYIVGVMVRKDGMISGSGIPQVEGILMRRFEVNWLRVLILKFLGGTIALGAGLSLGREGPSVQMGASIGQGFSKVCNRSNIEDKFLITSGAAAGIAGAFNAPLSGVIFALEEVHKNFSPLVLLSAMASSIVADFTVKQFLGLGPAFGFNGISALPLGYYWLLPILGIIVGFSGMIFCKGILNTQDIYDKFKKMPTEVKVIIPFILTGIIGMTLPILLGGGHGLIMSISEGGYTIKMLIILLIVKFLFTIIAFGSGTPGGIFFPLLVLGALVGDIFGILVCKGLKIPDVYILNFIIFAMAAHFAAIVKAPITGIVLITEMTGSFEHLLALTIVVIAAYVTSDLLRNEPIYESLLERRLKKCGDKCDDESCKAYVKKTLLELAVFMGSHIEGKKIKDITWPRDCLIVAIKRGGKEIIPKGNTEIIAGDFIVVLVDDNKAADVLVRLQELSTEVNVIQNDI
ncbi:ClC family H(+)/Cl(-) exchange transporter [Clostridium chrysemydis]|uniref:ClC family H(+)/Cl(-) exchange transporter n=1 Tax=Clostridium chrysemydis TaxID=2665504 RepID=UPI001884191A|nr:ClC family H(+)/Cl(-) exchange transporter [Clostridium chrysemydis]